jgi:hypothetical protein
MSFSRDASRKEVAETDLQLASTASIASFGLILRRLVWHNQVRIQSQLAVVVSTGKERTVSPVGSCRSGPNVSEEALCLACTLRGRFGPETARRGGRGA